MASAKKIRNCARERDLKAVWLFSTRTKAAAAHFFRAVDGATGTPLSFLREEQ